MMKVCNVTFICDSHCLVISDLTILPVPVMTDNYAYLVSDTRHNRSVVIDPGSASDVQVCSGSFLLFKHGQVFHEEKLFLFY